MNKPVNPPTAFKAGQRVQTKQYSGKIVCLFGPLHMIPWRALVKLDGGIGLNTSGWKIIPLEELEWSK